MRKLVLVLLLANSLLGCSLAPHYERPALPLPEHFKNPGKWVDLSKNPPVFKPDNWWEAFHDPILNELEQHLTNANQDLQIAYARYKEAESLAQVARASFYPNFQGLANADRQGTSRTDANSTRVGVFNQFLLGTYLSYEVDVWGRVRDSVTASERKAQASAVDIGAAYLSLHAALASDYFSLRSYDEQQAILNTTVRAYKKALAITQNRYRGGIAPISDVQEAQTQLENAKTAAADMALRRSQLENAIAVLVGEVASDFSIKARKQPFKSVSVAPIIPSTLLLRRPDIVSAELQVQSANASIGVARAAFFPLIQLTSSVGFESKSISNLLSKPSMFWSLGPFSILTLTQPLAQATLFDGGALLGQLRNAKASYFETAATYRQTVLTAFKEVEDALAAVDQLDKEASSQKAATLAAQKAWQQEQYRYTGGLVTFLQVVVAENAALQSELALVSIRNRQQLAAIQLIKATGGGWATPPFVRRRPNFL